MKIGDKIEVLELMGDDSKLTNLKIGATGTIDKFGSRAAEDDHPLDILLVRFDEEYQGSYGGVDVRWMFRKQLEVIEEAP
jgi:hypothetical protein